MSHVDAARVLTGLGFTGLESEVYAFLVRESPATGYRIAQAIHKPVANTYKAIETLRVKGAIEVEEAESRQCRAVPTDELLDRLGRDFEAKRANAKELLGKLNQPVHEDRVYQLNAQPQIIQRAREMLGRATQIALLAGPIGLVHELDESLMAAAARGVEVFVKSNGDPELPRVETLVVTRPDDLVNFGGHLRLVIDGESVLVGVLGASEQTALYSKNPILAAPYHEGLAAEMNLLAVAERIEDGAGPKRLAKAITTVRPASTTPGLIGTSSEPSE